MSGFSLLVVVSLLAGVSLVVAYRGPVRLISSTISSLLAENEFRCGDNVLPNSDFNLQKQLLEGTESKSIPNGIKGWSGSSVNLVLAQPFNGNWPDGQVAVQLKSAKSTNKVTSVGLKLNEKRWEIVVAFSGSGGKPPAPLTISYGAKVITTLTASDSQLYLARVKLELEQITVEELSFSVDSSASIGSTIIGMVTIGKLCYLSDVAVEGKNNIVNNDFSGIKLTANCMALNKVSEWTFQSLLNICKGSSQDSKWSGQQIARLNIKQSRMAQKMLFKSATTLMLSFMILIGDPDISLSVIWNGKPIEALNFKDKFLHEIIINVQANAANNELALAAYGTSTKGGVMLTNFILKAFKLRSKYVEHMMNYIINSVFQLPSFTGSTKTSFKNIPGWGSSMIVLNRNAATIAVWGQTPVLTMGTSKGYDITQTMNVENGDYLLSVTFASYTATVRAASVFISWNDALVWSEVLSMPGQQQRFMQVYDNLYNSKLFIRVAGQFAAQQLMIKRVSLRKFTMEPLSVDTKGDVIKRGDFSFPVIVPPATSQLFSDNHPEWQGNFEVKVKSVMSAEWKFNQVAVLSALPQPKNYLRQRVKVKTQSKFLLTFFYGTSTQNVNCGLVVTWGQLVIANLRPFQALKVYKQSLLLTSPEEDEVQIGFKSSTDTKLTGIAISGITLLPIVKVGFIKPKMYIVDLPTSKIIANIRTSREKAKTSMKTIPIMSVRTESPVLPVRSRVSPTDLAFLSGLSASEDSRNQQLSSHKFSR